MLQIHSWRSDMKLYQLTGYRASQDLLLLPEDKKLFVSHNERKQINSLIKNLSQEFLFVSIFLPASLYLSRSLSLSSFIHSFILS